MQGQDVDDTRKKEEERNKGSSTEKVKTFLAKEKWEQLYKEHQTEVVCEGAYLRAVLWLKL